jgi:cob(I)alamin adenosyltransferase
MVRLTRIYTRTGDDGTTGMVDGSRVSKAGLRMAAIGDVDEANSAIGVALTHLPEGTLRDALLAVQNDLFDCGADLATPGDDPGALRIVPKQVATLEAAIDAATAASEPLRSFILPGGSAAAAALHLARAITRRAERAMVAAAAEAPVGAPALAYINRLSDFLFVAARAVNQNAGGDVLWVPGGTR